MVAPVTSRSGADLTEAEAEAELQRELNQGSGLQAQPVQQVATSVIGVPPPEPSITDKAISANITRPAELVSKAGHAVAGAIYDAVPEQYKQLGKEYVKANVTGPGDLLKKAGDKYVESNVTGPFAPAQILKSGMSPTPAPPAAQSQPVGHTASSTDGSGHAAEGRPVYATIPAHSVPLVSPGISKEIGAGEVTQFEGAQQQTEIEAQRADELAQAKAESEEALRIQQLQAAQDRDRQRAALEDHLGQIQAKADAVAAKKVDPKQYMEQLGLGGQFLGALAIGLGAFGQAITGAPNIAFEMLNKQIDRNIDAQKAAIEQGKAGLEVDRSLYGEKYRLFGDDEKARAAAKQEALAAAAQQIDAIVARYDSPDIRAKGEQIKGQLAREFGFEQAKLEKYVPTQVVQTGRQTLLSNIKADDVIALPNGQRVAITDTAAREKARQKLDLAREIREAIPKVNALLGQSALERATPKWQREYKAATKVFTVPEVQEGSGKGGIGTIKMFNEPVELSGRGLIGVQGALNAAGTIADAKEREAEATLKSANPVIVREIPDYINPKTHEQERKFTILGPYKPGTAIPPAAPPPPTFRQ